MTMSERENGFEVGVPARPAREAITDDANDVDLPRRALRVESTAAESVRVARQHWRSFLLLAWRFDLWAAEAEQAIELVWRQRSKRQAHNAVDLTAAAREPYLRYGSVTRDARAAGQHLGFWARFFAVASWHGTTAAASGFVDWQTAAWEQTTGRLRTTRRAILRWSRSASPPRRRPGPRSRPSAGSWTTTARPEPEAAERLGLRDRAADAWTDVLEHQAALERRRRIDDSRRLQQLLWQRLGVQVRVDHARVVVDDLTFTLRHCGPDGPPELVLLSSCARCGTPVMSNDIRHLADLGRLIVAMSSAPLQCTRCQEAASAGAPLTVSDRLVADIRRLVAEEIARSHVWSYDGRASRAPGEPPTVGSGLY